MSIKATILLAAIALASVPANLPPRLRQQPLAYDKAMLEAWFNTLVRAAA